jgi:hypothetical protein
VLWKKLQGEDNNREEEQTEPLEQCFDPNSLLGVALWTLMLLSSIAQLYIFLVINL